MFSLLLSARALMLCTFPIFFLFLFRLCMSCYELFIQKKHNLKTTADKIKIMGRVTAIIIFGIILCYGGFYYTRYTNFLESNKTRHIVGFDRLSSVNNGYEEELDKMAAEGEITSLERDIMYRQEWLDQSYRKENLHINPFFPFKAHNRVMFFSLYFVIVAGCFFSIYIKPTNAAFERNHAQKNVILWLNILTGWTVIGWLVLLIWTNPSSAPQPEPHPQTQPSTDHTQKDAADKLMQIKALLDAGAITQEEYDEKKKELLNQI